MPYRASARRARYGGAWRCSSRSNSCRRIGNFQNPDFLALFANYACAFARRFLWVQTYTPVNEMFITAVLSTKYGW